MKILRTVVTFELKSTGSDLAEIRRSSLSLRPPVPPSQRAEGELRSHNSEGITLSVGDLSSLRSVVDGGA